MDPAISIIIMFALILVLWRCCLVLSGGAVDFRLGRRVRIRIFTLVGMRFRRYRLP